MRTENIFGRSHLPCPECGHKDCFHEIIGSKGTQGYCFSHCGWVLDTDMKTERTSFKHDNGYRNKQAEPEAFETISELFVLKSLPDFPQMVEAFFERSGIIMDNGIDKPQADLLACGQMGISHEYLVEELHDYYMSKGNYFAALMLRITKDIDLNANNSVGFQNGFTLFWYRNYGGKYVNCKKILYGADGRRRKDVNPAWLYPLKNGYKTCLYNEHLLRERPNDKIILVESEKTAIISACYYPTAIWLASGSATGLTAEKAKVLKGRYVAIAYDNDEAGFNGAIRARQLLLKAGARARVIEPKSLFGEGCAPGYDLADYIIDKLGGLNHAA